MRHVRGSAVWIGTARDVQRIGGGAWTTAVRSSLAAATSTTSAGPDTIASRSSASWSSASWSSAPQSRAS